MTNEQILSNVIKVMTDMFGCINVIGADQAQEAASAAAFVLGTNIAETFDQKYDAEIIESLIHFLKLGITTGRQQNLMQ